MVIVTGPTDSIKSTSLPAMLLEHEDYCNAIGKPRPSRALARQEHRIVAHSDDQEFMHASLLSKTCYPCPTQGPKFGLDRVGFIGTVQSGVRLNWNKNVVTLNYWNGQQQTEIGEPAADIPGFKNQK